MEKQMNAQERALMLWNSAKNNPSPVGIIQPAKLVLKDYQASGKNGQWAHVTCEAHEEIEKVIEFVQNKTGLSRWLIRTGSPYWRDEKWNWQLIRGGFKSP